GGLSKGDLASKIAVETIENFIKHSRMEDITWPIKPQDEYSMEENRFLAAVSLANWNIFTEFQRSNSSAAMGTTLVGLLIDGDRLVMANIGDSRIYRIRNKAIEQLTDDHSLVMDEVRRGNMTPEEARNHPQKHVINRALGITESTRVDISTLDPEEGDIFLLCSDGLTDMLLDEDLLSAVEENGGKDMKSSGEKLVEEAKNRGGRDNITIVLIHF
ncbi:MAG: protein phosphatase 2C domain-containing protein, partial [Pseudomonadota bacterium]